MYKTINVMIAEDHSMIREGLKQLIQLEPDINVIAGCADGKEVVEKYKECTPDVVLIDINMPKLNGLEALEKIKQYDSNVKAVMLTIHAESDYLLRALDLGALGYVLKDGEASELIEAIKKANNNEVYIQAAMAAEMVSEQKKVSRMGGGPRKNLTEREKDVLKLLSKGMLNKEIAASLYISEKTVKNHVSSIFCKLNVQDRTQAAVFAIKNRITD